MRAAAKARTDSAHSLALRPPLSLSRARFFHFLASALSLSFAAALFLSRAASPFPAPLLLFPRRLSLSRALLFPFPAKAGIQIGSAEYGGIETLPAFAETGDSNWIPAFAGKGFDNIAGRTMTDSFSSTYDSKRNLLPRRWRWIVGALALTLAISVFLCRDWLAMYLGYEKTGLSPGVQFLRDLFIGIAAILGIVMAGWRNFALDRQSKAALEQAKIGNRQAQHDRDRIADERFSDAVKLLAQKDAENKPAIDARIGGIYSLQTLANNRIAEYGAQVVKTLISYIKQNAQLTAQPPLKENETPKEARTLGEDVKTVFNVLEQLLAAREKDSAEWNEPPDGIKLSDQDLSFSGQDFSRLDLSTGQVDGLHRYIWGQGNLQGANLFSAQLLGAKLFGAQLQDANLSMVDLQGADLSKAQLQGARLLYAELQEAELSDAELQGAELSGADLHDANLSRARLQGAKLSRVDLQGAKLSDAQLQSANLSDTQLQGADLSGAQLQGAILSGAQLQGVNLIYADLNYADLSSAKLDGKTRLPDNLSGKIWHSGQPELSGIVPPPPDAEWDLEPFMDSAYALDFVLRRHAHRFAITKVKSEDAMRAKKFRVAVRKLLDEKKLPEGFPEDWRDWLAEVKADGSHPDDSKFSG